MIERKIFFSFPLFLRSATLVVVGPSGGNIRCSEGRLGVSKVVYRKKKWSLQVSPAPELNGISSRMGQLLVNVPLEVVVESPESPLLLAGPSPLLVAPMGAPNGFS